MINTINVLIVVLVFLLGYWIIRNLYYGALTVEYKHKLYALRDKLRRYAIDKKIKGHDEFFDYMDSSICVTIRELDTINIVTALWLYNKYKHLSIIKQYQNIIDNNIQSNEFSKELYNEYGTIIVDYLRRKHYILSSIIYFIINIIVSWVRLNRAIDYSKEAIQQIRVYPETSSTGIVFLHSNNGNKNNQHKSQYKYS